MPRGQGAPDPVREAIDELVAELGLEPPVSAEEIVDALGIQVEPFTEEDLAGQFRLDAAPIYGALATHEDGDVIYLRDDLDSYRRTTTLFHELGHYLIRWHRPVLRMGPASIPKETRDLMEAEARAFALDIRFLGGRFDDESDSMPYGLESAVYLATRYGLSYEMAIRRYAEHGDGRTSLLRIFTVDRRWNTLEPQVTFRYFIKPNGRSRRWDFPESVGERLPPHHPITRFVTSGDCYAKVIRLEDEPLGGVPCAHELVASERNAFVLSQAL